jgi:N utilization substance protein B
VPWRVIVNEAVNLAKLFGSEEGYKFVNGVLDKLARQLRPAEVQDGK